MRYKTHRLTLPLTQRHMNSKLVEAAYINPTNTILRILHQGLHIDTRTYPTKDQDMDNNPLLVLCSRSSDVLAPNSDPNFSLHLVPPLSWRRHRGFTDERKRDILRRMKERTDYALIGDHLDRHKRAIQMRWNIQRKKQDHSRDVGYELFEPLGSMLVDLLEGLRKSWELSDILCNGLENKMARLMM